MKKLTEYKKVTPAEEIAGLTKAHELIKRLLALVEKASLRRKNENK